MLRPSTEFVVNLTCNPFNMLALSAFKSILKNLANNINVFSFTFSKSASNPLTSASVAVVTSIFDNVKSIISAVIVKVFEGSSLVNPLIV